MKIHFAFEVNKILNKQLCVYYLPIYYCNRDCSEEVKKERKEKYETVCLCKFNKVLQEADKWARE